MGGDAALGAALCLQFNTTLRRLPLLHPRPSPSSPPPRSAALVGALHLLGNNTEIVKRWVNEIQEAAQNKNTMVQVCVGCKVQGRGQGRKGWLQGVQGLVGAQRSALNHDNNAPPPQFHAVALLHALRATDRLAISKLVSSLTKAAVKSPLAQCLLVRYVAQVIQV